MTAVTALGPAERPHRGSTHLEDSCTFRVAEPRGVCRLHAVSSFARMHSPLSDLLLFLCSVDGLDGQEAPVCSPPGRAFAREWGGKQLSSPRPLNSSRCSSPFLLPLSFCWFTLISDRSRYPNCEPSCLHCCRFQSSRVTVVLFTAAEAAEA